MRTANVIRLATSATLVLAAVAVLSAQEPILLLEQAGRQMQQQIPPQQQGQPMNPNPMGGNQGPKNPQPNDPMSPVYIQQMFDTMAIMEAERFLPLTNEQYPSFVQKLRRLQEARMQANRRRSKAMNELRPMVGRPAGGDTDVPDSVIDAKLKELAAVEAEGQAGVKKALDDIDAGLTVRQRARFRMLEENVERRKIDFLTKVRGGGPGFGGIPQ